jgi:hypothetical protein
MGPPTSWKDRHDDRKDSHHTGKAMHSCRTRSVSDSPCGFKGQQKTQFEQSPAIGLVQCRKTLEPAKFRTTEHAAVTSSTQIRFSVPTAHSRPQHRTKPREDPPHVNCRNTKVGAAKIAQAPPGRSNKGKVICRQIDYV